MADLLTIDDVMQILQENENGPQDGQREVGEDPRGLRPGELGRGGRRPGAGRRPGRGGRARGGRGGRGRGRGLQQRLREFGKKKRNFQRRQTMADLQAGVFNRSGRSRNQDFHIAAQSDNLKRKACKGRSKWKQWSPEAILRAGFFSESSSRKDISVAIQGAGESHAGQCRYVVAQSIERGQQTGLARARDNGCEMLVRNIMFDESTLELCGESEPSLLTWSVLCSHAQWTFKMRGADSVQDEHLIRSPQILLPVMNSVTMHNALSKGSGGFACHCEDADFQATITTCDAHAANLRMLRFWEQSLPAHHLFLPHLCIQHRTGNVIEQLTKLVGTLGGNFSVAKVLNKANLLRGLRKRVSDRVRSDLVIVPEMPAAAHEEWSEGKRTAKKLVDLCLSFDEDAEEPARPGSLRQAFHDLLEFYDAPWTGPAAGERGGGGRAAQELIVVLLVMSSSYYIKFVVWSDLS